MRNTIKQKKKLYISESVAFNDPDIQFINACLDGDLRRMNIIRLTTDSSKFKFRTRATYQHMAFLASILSDHKLIMFKFLYEWRKNEVKHLREGKKGGVSITKFFNGITECTNIYEVFRYYYADQSTKLKPKSFLRDYFKLKPKSFLRDYLWMKATLEQSGEIEYMSDNPYEHLNEKVPGVRRSLIVLVSNIDERLLKLLLKGD